MAFPKDLKYTKKLDDEITLELTIVPLETEAEYIILKEIKDATYATLYIFLSFTNPTDEGMVNLEEAISFFKAIEINESFSYIKETAKYVAMVDEIINSKDEKRIKAFLDTVKAFLEYLTIDDTKSYVLTYELALNLISGEKTYLIDINRILELMVKNMFSFDKESIMAKTWLKISMDPMIIERANKNIDKFNSKTI